MNLRLGFFLSICVLVLPIWVDAAPAVKATDAPADSKPAEGKPAADKRTNAVFEIAAKLEPTRKVVYKHVGDRDLQLHVFEPTGHKPTDKRSCLIAIHGGGWRGGEPRWMYTFATRAAESGMVGISVEYRRVGKPAGVTAFESVKDARSAMRYVRSHAAEFGIDPQKMVVTGSSAGGHLAAATALFDGIDEAGEDTSVSPIPNCLVLLWPVSDTSKEGYGNSLLGARWQELSPVHHVRAGMPPTLLFHGTGDTTVPFKNAQAFQAAMTKAGNECELVAQEGGGHGYVFRDLKLYDEVQRKTEAFLTAHGFLGDPAKK